MTARDLIDEALKLPVQERARVIRELIRSLDEAEAEDPEEVERAWTAVLEARADAALRGETEGRDFATVCDDLEARLRRRAR